MNPRRGKGHQAVVPKRLGQTETVPSPVLAPVLTDVKTNRGEATVTKINRPNYEVVRDAHYLLRQARD